MPVYNGALYISEAIDSVLSQEYTNWELIIINDGSTDGTQEILNSFTDHRIQYFTQSNQGVSAARNLALEKITGTYFCFLDADDILPNNSLKSRLSVFEKDPKVDFVDGKVQCFQDNTNNVKRTWVPDFIGNPTEALIRLDASCFFGPTWMIKVDPKTTYLLDQKMTHAEDLKLYLSISNEKQYSFTSDLVLHYRLGNDSAMSNLEQLEKGYSSYYSYVKESFSDSNKSIIYLKGRILRIMFLSYLSNKKLVRALNVILWYLR